MYRQMFGSLMYLTNTRPYICFTVNKLSQYMVELRNVHLIATKHVMRYMKGTNYYGHRYASDREIILQGFIDSYWDGSIGDRKSTSRCCFTMGSTMISWFNKKKTNVALNTDEEEYMATCSTSNEEVWLCKLLTGLFDLELEETFIL
jgi:hypothetical protein